MNPAGSLARKLATAILALGCAVAGAQNPPPSAPASALRDQLLEWIFAKDTATLEKHFPTRLQFALQKATPERRAGVLHEFDQLLLTQRGFKMERHIGNDPIVTTEDEWGAHFAATYLDADVHGNLALFEIVIRQWNDGREVADENWPKTVILRAKLETGVWRLYGADIVTAGGTDHYDLTDPELFYRVAYGEGAAEEYAAVKSVRAVVKAELQYAVRFPEVGFTCTIADLGALKSAITQDPHHAEFVEDRLAGGYSTGYHIQITGCGDDEPAQTFTVSAVPQYPGRRGFCADQQGVVFYSDDASPDTCITDRVKLERLVPAR